MNKNDRRALKGQAKQCLADASCDPRKLVLIHTGAVLLLSALLAAADYILEQQIGSTGGLSGIGSRSVLSTIQTVLHFAQTVLLPFWQMGYIFVTLKLSRREAASPQDLLEGFRRFGPVLRLTILKTAVVTAILFISSNIASTLFFLTPFASPLYEAIAPLMSDPAAMNDPAALQEAMLAAADSILVPLMTLFLLVFLAIGIPFFYRYRMASYFLLDSDAPKAFKAMQSSWKTMRHRCLDLFKLDVSFWWFYLSEILLSFLAFGDLILGWMGIPLPISADAAYFLFYGIYLLGQLALYLWRKNEVEVTYACTYDLLQNRCDPQPKPQNHPWSDQV